MKNHLNAFEKEEVDLELLFELKNFSYGFGCHQLHIFFHFIVKIYLFGL